MSVEIKPTSIIKTRLGIQYGGPAHKYFTNECYKAMNSFVPKRTGNLRGDFGAVDIQADKIIYESDYAKYQYRGYTSGPVKKYTTDGTGPYWDKKMVSSKMADIEKKVQKYIDTYGG